MAVLKDILYKVSLLSASGDMNQEIKAICFDSRKVAPGSLFVAVKGSDQDGHSYIEAAIKLGASAIVFNDPPKEYHEGVAYLQVENSAQALGIMAGNFYESPSSQLQLVAVTGTNGKTTTVSLLFNLFVEAGYSVGLLSTVNNRINEQVLPTTHTTPDAVSMNKLLRQMVDTGCTHCFMEASSHAIDQERIAGLTFAGAVFTNLSHDHLDYHGSFEEYIRAKKKLFDNLTGHAFALVNIDDKRGTIMLQNTKALKRTYGIKKMGDFKAKILSNTIKGLEIVIEQKSVWFKLIGEFNAYNLLAVYATAVLLGEEPDAILTQLSDLSAAPGRFDQVNTRSGITAIVDYAHTPDALDKVLTTITGFRTGTEQLITVVGCGGNRDKEKRPLMAKIASKYSDKVILTSDNPRNEEPEEIIKEMEVGVSPSQAKKVLSIVDRREAIKTACSLSGNSDIILVAGKGHENYQEIKGERKEFDDKKILTEMLNLMHE